MKNKKNYIQSFFCSKNFKDNLVFIMFVFFFTIALSIIFKRYFESKPCLQTMKIIPSATKYLTKNETPPNNESLPITPKDNKLTALDLIDGILRKGLPLSNLKAFLQSIPDPWASPILISLNDINTVETYSNLSASLIVHYFPCLVIDLQKNNEDLFVFMQNTGKYSFPEDKKNILKALQHNNIERALSCFEKLSNSDKLALSFWEKMAKNRLDFESICKNILLDLSK